MNTKIRKIDITNVDSSIIIEAANIIKHGGTVVFPTETVYGLGADALNEKASKKIYEAKGRPSDNPLIVHISDKRDLIKIVSHIPEVADMLMEKFWPGPLTLIFNKTKDVPKGTTGGLDTVAVRMPNHPVALELIKQSGTCIAAPSANISGKPSPTTGEHVIEDLDGRVDMIINSGSVGIGIESTILDVTCNPPMILRPGYVTVEMVKEIIGNVAIDNFQESDKPKAPGMKYRHYAPKADMVIYSGETSKVIEAINSIAKEKYEKGLKVGIIATEESQMLYKYGKVFSIGKRKSEKQIAKNLYAVLRAFDDMEVDIILSESFSEGDLGYAIMNRLVKASSNNIIKI